MQNITISIDHLTILKRDQERYFKLLEIMRNVDQEHKRFADKFKCQ